MLAIIRHGILLTKGSNSFESMGVMNPAAIKVKDKIYLFYRAVSESNQSSIGYCILSNALKIEFRSRQPLLEAEFEFESKGMEDPRIVKIESMYYLSYTAFNGTNALGAMATSTDLITWEKIGIIVPQITYKEFLDYISKNETIRNKYKEHIEHEINYKSTSDQSFIWDKNLILFPRKINDMFYFLHRIKPDIQIVVSVKKLEDLNKIFWEKYFSEFDQFIVLSPKYQHESSYIGSGCPPIETEQGWILIYHGVEEVKKALIYSACVALLDLENPQKEIARLPYPLFRPEQQWELKGKVNNVCFPTGAIVEDDRLYLYYGAADERIATVSVSLNALMTELQLNKINNG